MNERIKELLIKAGFTNAYTDPKEGFELVFVDEEHTTECVGKFAELIVRECIDRIDDLITCDDEGNQVLDCDDVRTELLEHFGVEE